jgi:hypothetical protein
VTKTSRNSILSYSDFVIMCHPFRLILMKIIIIVNTRGLLTVWRIRLIYLYIYLPFLKTMRMKTEYSWSYTPPKEGLFIYDLPPRGVAQGSHSGSTIQRRSFLSTYKLLSGSTQTTCYLNRHQGSLGQQWRGDRHLRSFGGNGCISKKGWKHI